MCCTCVSTRPSRISPSRIRGGGRGGRSLQGAVKRESRNRYNRYGRHADIALHAQYFASGQTSSRTKDLSQKTLIAQMVQVAQTPCRLRTGVLHPVLQARRSIGVSSSPALVKIKTPTQSARFATYRQRLATRRVQLVVRSSAAAVGADGSQPNDAAKFYGGLESGWSAKKQITGWGPKAVVARIKQNFYKDGKLDKSKLASVGASVTLSYGFISNVNAFSLLMIAWYTFTKSTGLSPLDPGQWPKYLTLYAGLYATIGTILRPARIAACGVLTPVFENIVTFFQKRFKFSRPWAFAATVFCVNILGTLTYFAVGGWLVCKLLGMPLFPTKV
eukprot:1192686-Prorocentrum_minimum.AAC.2